MYSYYLFPIPDITVQDYFIHVKVEKKKKEIYNDCELRVFIVKRSVQF